MRIVIDFQAIQTPSRDRGIGRYTLSLTKALIRNNNNNHEIILVINGLLSTSINFIRNEFSESLPKKNIRVWFPPEPILENTESDHWHQKTAEQLREAFIATLRPDIVYIPSLFEADGAVTSIGTFCNLPTAVTLYDLIPLIHPSLYLKNSDSKNWYFNKLDQLRRADLLIAVSESSRQEGLNYLGLPQEKIITALPSADEQFIQTHINKDLAKQLKARYNLTRPFILYTSGPDPRKNMEGLIEAYSLLPKNLKNCYQLVIVCSIGSEYKQKLIALAKQHGLNSSDLILTGFIPDKDLLILYQLCFLFVFPSLHEGFGLPILEAMCCGAPVIASNSSSLPEVLGWDKALFDPHSSGSMAILMQQALTDHSFRSHLIKHSSIQSKLFSWDKAAKTVLTTFEQFHIHRHPISSCSLVKQRPKLAYISPLPPLQSGISDYSSQLLPELSRHYNIDVIVDQQEVNDDQIKACWPIRSVQWFRQHAQDYVRILYHFGNSPFHTHMFDLLLEFPGVVVLHDFFLSGLLQFIELHQNRSGLWSHELFYSHGYSALHQRFNTSNLNKIISKYPANSFILKNSIGILVHSEHSKNLFEIYYKSSQNIPLFVIPHLRKLAMTSPKEITKKALGFSEQDILVCSFGQIQPFKLIDRLLNAWNKSSLSIDLNCYLIIVGKKPIDIIDGLNDSNFHDKIRITGWVDHQLYNQYLSAADIAVQLRAHSKGETSGALLDCMSNGIATIINTHESMAKIDETAIWKLCNNFRDEDLICALETLRKDDNLRLTLGNKAKEIINHNHTPRLCADLYAKHIETSYDNTNALISKLIPSIANIKQPVENNDIVNFAQSIHHTFPPFSRKKMFIDVSILKQHDAKTGIQRVIRSLLRAFLLNPNHEYQIEPVYTSIGINGYYYARQFTLNFLELPNIGLPDEPIDYTQDDVFIGLNLSHMFVIKEQKFFQKLRNYGVTIKFIVYDLLPLIYPQFFPKEIPQLHQEWLNVIFENDGLLCISQTVAQDVKNYLVQNNIECPNLSIDSFHLGADIENSIPTTGVDNYSDQILKQMAAEITFLMIGTIEPRKGHRQTIAAFDLLWEQGFKGHLAIVGKEGWMVEDVISTINNHHYSNKKLFWFNGVSDEYMNLVIKQSQCLIAASLGEGFGLPLIEAARHKLPIIARDIPVFREVAQDFAFYFSGTKPEELSFAIRNWLTLYQEGKHTRTDHMPWLTWEQSANQLLSLLEPV